MIERLERLLIESDYFEINEEELAIINRVNSLKRPFIEGVVRGTISIKNISNFNMDYYSDYVPEEYKRNFYYKVFAELLPKAGYIREEYISSVLENVDFENYNLTSDDIKEIIRIGNERTKNPSEIDVKLVKIDDGIDYNLYINTLLDYKRYDIIAQKVLNYRYDVNQIKISDEVCQRVLNEFPIGEYGMPSFLVPYLINANSDLINLEQYCKLVSESKLVLNSEYIYKLMDKASQEERNRMPQKLGLLNLENEETIELLNYLLSKNQIIYVNKWRLQSDPEVLEKYIEVLTYRLKNNLPVNFETIRDFYSVLEEDEETKSIILNSKYALYLHDYQRTQEEIGFSNIDFDNDDIDLAGISINAFLDFPDEVFDKLIEKGNQSTELSLSVRRASPKHKDRILKIINSDLKVRSLSLPKQLIDRELLIELLNNEKLTNPDTIQAVFGGNIFKRLLEETDLAFDFMEKYPIEFANRINYGYDSVKEHPQILEYIYHNKYYMSVLLDALEMKTNDYYTDEIYEHAKEFLESEYEIDPSSLDRLKAASDLTVLKYIHGENIKDFLNLEVEEQNKILMLFSKTVYNSEDVKSALESIIQYSFSQNRPEDADIFPRICHAIVDENETEINILKCRILGLITEEEFKNIKASIGIDESSLDEYLNKLLYSIKAGNNIDNLLTALHNITNAYILKARQEYHSNYLYLNQEKEFYSRKYLDFQKVIRMINNEETISLGDNYSIEEIIDKLKEKYDMSEYQNCPSELFFTTLYNNIKESIKGNPNGNLENNIKMLKYIIDYNNELYKKENPKTIESIFDMPYQIEKKAMQSHMDKRIIGRANTYSLNGESLYNLLAQNLESKGVNKYILAMTLNYYIDGVGPIPTKKLKSNIDDMLSDMKIINPTTGEVIENCNVDYLISHIDEIEEYIIEEDFGWFAKKETIGKYAFAIDNKYGLIDVLNTIKNDQSNLEYIKSSIGKVVGEYKKVVKDPSVLKNASFGTTPMQDLFNELINVYNSDVVVQKNNELILASNYVKQELLKRGYSESQIETLKPISISYKNNDISKIYRDYFEIMQSLYDKGELYFKSSMRNNFLRGIELSNSKKRYAVPQSSRNIASIIAELDLKSIKETIISNPELYEEMKTFLEVKKLHDTPEFIAQAMKDLSLPIGLDSTTIAGFVSYYDLIRKEFEKEKKDISNISFIDIVKKGEKYGGVAPVFKEILTPEDARLIKENDGISATAKTKNNERLIESVDQTVKNYRRKEVTVPTFDENVKIGDKEVNIVVGNFTDHTNLTHGERTGSCMRIGGVGEKLYYFALNDENGFHIRFEDPETNEYISRVTGFRNGNTVFLNQLRESCSEQYENEDVIEACKKSTQMLIEKSKNSACPIENVVITSGYAMKNYQDQVIDLDIDSAQNGLPTFYSDIKKEGIVLATTATEEKLKPINFDKSYVPTYETQRGKIIRGKNIDKTKELIKRVAAIKKLTEGHSYDEIGEFEFDTGIIYGVVNDDWYVYIDDEKNIVYDMISTDPRAKEEIKVCIIEMEEFAKSKYIEMEAFNNGGENKNR